MKIRLY